MKAFILEDNPSVRDSLRTYLKEDNPEVELAGEAASLSEARSWLKKHQPDLMLLDIELPDGTSFDLLEELRQADQLCSDVIFCTTFGYQEYLLRAMDFLALKYLLKPIDRKKLREAIQKAQQQQFDRETFACQISTLLETSPPNRQPAAALSNIIALPKPGGAIEMVDLNSILYFSSWQQGTMSQVHLSGLEKPLPCTRSIGYFKTLLTPAQHFFQIHQSLIINLKAMRRYHHEERAVTLNNGEVLYASVREGKRLRGYLLGGGEPSAESKLDEKGILSWIWKMMMKRG